MSQPGKESDFPVEPCQEAGAPPFSRISRGSRLRMLFLIRGIRPSSVAALRRVDEIRGQSPLGLQRLGAGDFGYIL